jgi:hypothetical protein
MKFQQFHQRSQQILTCNLIDSEISTICTTKSVAVPYKSQIKVKTTDFDKNFEEKLSRKSIETETNASEEIRPISVGSLQTQENGESSE